MPPEIDDTNAESIAKELALSFAKNGNDRNGQARDLVEMYKNGVNILDYSPEALMGNEKIRETLMREFDKVKKHNEKYKPEEIDSKFFIDELALVFRLGRNKLGI